MRSFYLLVESLRKVRLLLVLLMCFGCKFRALDFMSAWRFVAFPKEPPLFALSPLLILLIILLIRVVGNPVDRMLSFSFVATM